MDPLPRRDGRCRRGPMGGAKDLTWRSGPFGPGFRALLSAAALEAQSEDLIDIRQFERSDTAGTGC